MWKNFLSLIYPSTCLVCDGLLHVNENMLCLSCVSELPKTPLNHIIRKEVGIQQYNASIALFEFNNINCKKLIHQLKYEGNYQLGEFFGIELGKAILTNLSTKNFDYLIPVPINRRKTRARGYNQSYILAKQVSKIIKVPVLNVLSRKRKQNTQTNKNRYQRWENVEGEFSVKSKHNLDYKHLLIVDDVLTSGATIDTCIKELKKKYSVKVSIAVLAIA
ncbi:MAG: hypothetical protein CL853_08345 [Crocinitomicaceae bacterium]|nr:hypothetical protein [Crocinitomicaceae bacterium]